MNQTNKKTSNPEKQLVKKTYSRPRLQPLGSINQTTRRKEWAWDLDNNFPFIGASH